LNVSLHETVSAAAGLQREYKIFGWRRKERLPEPPSGRLNRHGEALPGRNQQAGRVFRDDAGLKAGEPRIGRNEKDESGLAPATVGGTLLEFKRIASGLAHAEAEKAGGIRERMASQGSPERKTDAFR
jgi:hypothetical protein